MSGTLPVAALIPTWNRWDDTRLCLESIAASDPVPSRIIVVDNGSTDGTPEHLRTDWPGVELIALESNVGFSRAVNMGLRLILESGEQRAVFLLNNDVVLAPGVLGRLWETLESDGKIAGVCPLITYFDPPGRVWYGGGRVALWRGYVGHRYIRREADGVPVGVVETDYLTGAAVLLRSDALRDIGLLDEDFSFYAEDVNWSLRAVRRGWRLCFDPAERVAHRVSASIGGQLSLRKIANRLRSLTRLLRRHAPPWAWFTTIPLFMILDALRVAWLVATGRIGERRG
jgi:GT2 family glycosyltransferase